MGARICLMASLLFLALAAPAKATELDWLSGHWCGVNAGVLNEEVWLPAHADGLIGVHRDSYAGALKGFEYLRIVRESTGWVLLAQPSGEKPVAFTASKVSEKAIEFVNPQHDFPRRVRYRLLDAETLQAEIDDGTEQGARQQWIWQRNCEVPTPVGAT